MTATTERALLELLRLAPKSLFSDGVGRVARARIPTRLRPFLLRRFALQAGIDLDEVELPLGAYPTLDAFFTRRLRAGVRPVAVGAGLAVAPCDGVIAAAGVAVGGTLVQAKGRDYTLAGLLGDPELAARFDGGAYVTIYLSPRDYHRVHFPVEGKVLGFHHVPGRLYPVNALASRNVEGLFATNERLATLQSSPLGDVAVVMVGAMGVGHITVTYDDVETHAVGRGRPGGPVSLSSPLPVARGDELGCFHLGSTVIVLFQQGRVTVEELAVGARVRCGQRLAASELARASTGVRDRREGGEGI